MLANKLQVIHVNNGAQSTHSRHMKGASAEDAGASKVSDAGCRSTVASYEATGATNSQMPDAIRSTVGSCEATRATSLGFSHPT